MTDHKKNEQQYPLHSPALKQNYNKILIVKKGLEIKHKKAPLVNLTGL